MAIVVGYFDSESAATEAMDRLLKTSGYEDVETRVYSSGAGDSGSTTVVGGFPNAGGLANNTSGTLGNNAMWPIPVTGWHDSDWLGEIDDEEQRFFTSAMQEGRGVLAMAKVDDDEAENVRVLFSRLGARTYSET